MVPYTFEIVTALTITVTGVILALYFLVLKRKGWLTENANEPNEPFYRCPNQECRKIFQKPIELTDLSQTAPRVYSACPHCGFDLETASPFAVGKKTKRTLKTPRSPEESVDTVKPSKPETPVESTEISEKPIVAKDVQKLPTASSKSLQARPPGCPHFFGYLKKIPKNTPMPDECLTCLKMVECISYDILQETMST